jgi:filamentous hemagglutinin family protein
MLLVAYCASPALVTAQVIINAGTPNDGRRAYVDQTQNGLPKINIAIPNAAGVSRNTYEEFNVGKQGLLLNNGANNSSTSLAGWVEGNPNLVLGQEAKLILNEVVGVRQSQLNGFIEVAGKKADVIVANENGVTCNGCGFINTNRAMLTTGTAIWGDGGSLDGLKIRQGTITIGADGLSHPDSRIDLLSQIINVQGDIHADRLNLIVGNNDVHYDSLNVTPALGIAGSLDVSLLGGMYANQINLIATGSGVGVRIDGNLVSAGNVGITTEGQLVNTGKISAQGRIQTQANATTNSGGIVAVDKLNLNGATLSNTGALVGQDVTIHLTSGLNNAATGQVGANATLSITSGSVDNAGQLNAKTHANIATHVTTNTGEMVATDTLTLTGTSLANSGKVTSTSLGMVLTDALTNSANGQLGATSTMSLKSRSIDNAGEINASEQITLQSDTLTNSGRFVSQGMLKTTINQGIENSGTVMVQSLDLTAESLKNLGTGVWGIHGGSTLNLGTLTNSGRLHFEAATNFNVGRLINSGQIDALGGLVATDSWSITNTGSLYGDDVLFQTQALNNTGRIEANHLTVSSYAGSRIPWAERLTGTVLNNSGLMAADRIQVTGFSKLINSNQISTDIAAINASPDSGKLQLQANTIDNLYGRIVARGNLDIAAVDLSNTHAIISSKGDLSIVASKNIINDTGLVLHQSTGAALIQASGALSNAAGQIEGQGQTLTVSAGDIDNSAGQIVQTSTRDPLAAPSTLNLIATAGGINTGELRNIKGEISGTGNVSVSAAKVLTDASSAALSSGGSLSFLDKSKIGSGGTTASGTYNWESDIAAFTAVTNAKTAADNATAAVNAAKTLATTASTDLQTAKDALTVLQANSSSTPLAISKAQSDVAAAQATYDTAQTTYTTAQNQSVAAQQAYADALAALPTINSGSSGTATAQPSKPSEFTATTPSQVALSTQTSFIQAGHDLSISLGAGLLDNRQGKLVAAHDVTITTQGDILAGQMQAGNALSITAKQLQIEQQMQATNTTLTTDALIVSGRVQGDNTLTIRTNSLTNSGILTGNTTDMAGRTSATSLDLGNTGMVQGNQSLSIQANQILNQATLSSGGDLTTTTAAQLENEALIFSLGGQKHYGVNIVNNAGRFYAFGDITMQGNTAGDNATSILNYTGRIEAQGNIDLRANTITNLAVVPTVNVRGIVNKTNDGTTILTQAKDTFNTDGKTSEILAGKNLNIRADELNNEYGIISARLNATIGTRLLKNRALGAIQTENYVVKAACFNCHQTVSYHDSWGGVIASGGTVAINATTVDNQTTDTRDGFAGLSSDPRVVIVDARADTRSPLTQAFMDRFGIVNGPAASAAGSALTLKLGSPRTLSDGLVLTASGQFDFSHYTLPNAKTGLFEKADAAAPYLIRGRTDLYTPATNGQYTSYDKFLGSDYLLTRLGVIPGNTKRLGDAWYETQLVQDQLFALTGRTHLVVGTDSDYDLMRNLMDAGLLAQAKFSLSAGDSLSAEQQAALTQNIVWPEWQVVEGQRVLVPKVYLASADIEDNDNSKGARIVATQVAITTRELKNSGAMAAKNSLAINAAGTVSGGGSYSGGKTVAIVADTVDLKSASIDSAGWLNISTVGELSVTATQLKAKTDATLAAGGDLNLKAQEFNTRVVRADGTSRTEAKYETSNIEAGGTVVMSAQQNLMLEGSKVEAGRNLLVQARQGNVNLVALKETSDYNYKGEGALAEIQAREKAAQEAAQEAAQNALIAKTGVQPEPQAPTFAAEIINNTQVHEESLQNVRLSAKGNATVQANQGDIKATALDVNAGQNITLKAGGLVQLDALQTNNSKVQDKQVLLGVSTDDETNAQTANYQNQITRQNSNQANGSNLNAGNDVLINGGQVSLSQTQAMAARDIKVEATDGGAVLKTVNLQAQRNVELSSAGNTSILSEAIKEGNNITQATSTIQAGNQANVTALGDLTVQGGDVQAKDINLIALGNVNLNGVQSQQTYGGGNDTSTATSTQSLNIKGDNVTVSGMGQNSNVTLVAANIDATNKAKITGTGNVSIESAENRTTRQWSTTSEDCNWWGKCTTTVTHGLEDKTSQVGSDIKGATVEVSAGKNLTTVASTIESAGNVSLSAQEQINYLAALNVDKNEARSNSSSSWGFGGFSVGLGWLGRGFADKQSTDITLQTRAAVTQLQSEADILSESGGNTRLQGTQVKAQTFTVNTGVGPNADPNAKILIEGVKETLQTSHTEKSESLVWQSQSGNGVTEEALKLAQINAKTKFSAPGGIDVQLPAGDPLKEQIKTLSQQPGMAWLNGLSQRKDVNWQAIKLAKDSWNYEQEGLTAAGALMLAIAVTIASQDYTGTAAASITGTSGGASYTATQAALSTAASQAAVSLANNKGDIGKTLSGMGKSESIKAIITSAMTAGALESLNPGWSKQLSNTGQFTQKAVINLTNAAVSASIKTAIQGGSYEDNLKTSLETAGIDTVAGWAASNIGQGYKNGDGALSELQGQYIAHKVAHALVGCASAAAKDSSCAAGAIGGAVGEAFAEMYGQSKYGTADGATLTSTQQQEVLSMSKLVTAAVAGVSGKDAQAAVDAAQNAVLNNFLTNGRFLTKEESKKIIEATSKWDGTSYKLVGAKSELQVAGDCSGITYKSYGDAGYGYTYVRADDFPTAAATEGFPFGKVNDGTLQSGDVLQFKGHVAIYLGKDDRTGQDLMWTASTSQSKYMIQTVSGFTKAKPLQGVYRYQVGQ